MALLRGGFKAGLWLGVILCICFSVSVEHAPRDGDEPVRSEEEGPWSWELRLACQPSPRTHPGRRARPPEAVKAPRGSGVRAERAAQLALR